ncbi:hypothetical protein [uncultured Sulfurimonas sp.]|jgi:hypothetical protein|uniref:hypothetical protein n=1 Tax=uncultured Sulfurimonas sp. TaxID=291845 RepID=UPI0032B1C908|nr:hypothetical protein [bacterium]
MIKIIKLLLQGGFLYKIRNYLLAKENLENIKKVDFTNISNYFKKYKKKGNIEKNVLVELFFEHPSTNNNNYIVNLLLGYKYSINTTALLKYNSCTDLKYVANKYNISQFDYVYSWKNFIYKYKALISLLKNLSNLKYDKKFGWHIYVDGIEIGDLVYDQFLRYSNQPTYRKLDLTFLLYVFNSLFYFHRYKHLLVKHNITDIILSHGVYAEYGILARVAASFEKEIKIYQWYNLNPMNISVHTATKEYIRKPRYYEQKLMDQLISKYSKKTILSEYDEYMEKRLKAEDKNQIDLAFVYQNNDINSIDEFKENYKMNSGKNIFIFSHAFVDSVKYVHWSLYSDYYTWLYETLVILANKSKEHNIFIKAHPSEPMYKCDITVKSTINEINQKYDANFIYLDKKVHNIVTFDMADSIITSNGTVAIEAVCYGIPVLVAASTLYENAKTVIQSKNIVEYRKYLENIENIKKPTIVMIDRAKFCFMFYSKYIYVGASYLRNGAVFGNANRFDEYSKFNKVYKTKKELIDEPLYNRFCAMIEQNDNDIINIYDKDA